MIHNQVTKHIGLILIIGIITMSLLRIDSSASGKNSKSTTSERFIEMVSKNLTKRGCA